jgi:hypothetical protein
MRLQLVRQKHFVCHIRDLRWKGRQRRKGYRQLVGRVRVRLQSGWIGEADRFGRKRRYLERYRGGPVDVWGFQPYCTSSASSMRGVALGWIALGRGERGREPWSR